MSAAAGDPEKFSAMEFELAAAKPGGLVEEAVLVLRETTQPGATVNAEGAKIVACPVVESFWADGASAAWKARPAYDCDLASAPGERDAKTGLWKFDLTSVASLWLAPDHRGSTSVALAEAADAPESFQVAFDGPALEGVGYRFSAGSPLPPVDMPTRGETSSGSGAAVSGGIGSGGSAPVGGGAGAAPVADPL